MIIHSQLSSSRKPTCSFKCCFQLTHIQVDSQSSSCATSLGRSYFFIVAIVHVTQLKLTLGRKFFVLIRAYVVKIFGALSEPILSSAPVSLRSFAPPKSCGALSSFFLRSKKTFASLPHVASKTTSEGIRRYFWIL